MHVHMRCPANDSKHVPSGVIKEPIMIVEGCSACTDDRWARHIILLGGHGTMGQDGRMGERKEDVSSCNKQKSSRARGGGLADRMYEYVDPRESGRMCGML